MNFSVHRGAHRTLIRNKVGKKLHSFKVSDTFKKKMHKKTDLARNEFVDEFVSHAHAQSQYLQDF